jgi:aminoglycoside 3-N-acetyltransferase
MINASVYHILRRSMGQSNRNRLKHILFRLRVELSPMYVARYGRFDASDLEWEVRRRIGDDFDILMVHSSYDMLRPMYTGTVQDVIAMLMRVCGSEKTLAMPAFFFGRAGLDVVEHYSRYPLFDVPRTPAQTGIISELFRRTPGVKRSLHPTHSVCAMGPMAEKLTSDHHLSQTTFGYATPFDVMASNETVILGIGVHFYRCLTQVHAVEDILGSAYPLPHSTTQLPVKLRNADGSELDYVLRLNDLSRRYTRRIDLLRSMMKRHELMEWSYHGVPMFGTRARRIVQVLQGAAACGRTIYTGGVEHMGSPNLTGQWTAT